MITGTRKLLKPDSLQPKLTNPYYIAPAQPSKIIK